MASSVAQYPCFCSSMKSSIEALHSPIPKRNPNFIKALKDSSSSESQQPKDVKDPVQLALAKAKAYKKSLQSNTNTNTSQNQDPVSEISKSEPKNDAKSAMEGAKEYAEKNGGLKQGKRETLTDEVAEKRKGKKEEPKISGIDFVGLGFADKRQGRGLPPGLVPISDPFPEGDLPDVEIIIGDRSRFADEKASKSKQTTDEKSELYKPKVSTWGVFPRPNNISKTFGGGKTIRPGEVLETAEEKEAKEARTRQLLSAYKRRLGLNIDPKLKAECEKALKDGDSLMDLGKLREALPFYEEVMNKLAFQSELHGLAALQWSICQDSLNRSNEARVMYEKLQSHPTVRVSKKAKQFVFSFQAMEMLKVTSSNASRRKTGYQNFFDAFIENKDNIPINENEVEDDSVIQALPYVIFLVSPILMVLVIALQKRLI